MGYEDSGRGAAVQKIGDRENSGTGSRHRRIAGEMRKGLGGCARTAAGEDHVLIVRILLAKLKRMSLEVHCVKEPSGWRIRVLSVMVAL